MSHVGRGKAILTLSVLWAVCLAGPGCTITIGPNETVATPNDPARMPPGMLDLAGAQGNAAPAGPGGVTQAGFQQPRTADLDADAARGNGKRDDGKNEAVPLGANGMPGPHTPPIPNLPTELAKTTLPPYFVEPPDILLIDAVKLIPRPPYRIEPLDVLIINATGTFPNQPISGLFAVGPDGTVALGFTYGIVRVGGLTLEQAQAAIQDYLGKRLNKPQVTLGLAQFRALQQVRGEHLVRPDGTINLGTYGCVFVAGLTMSQVKLVVEQHLSQFLQDPEIAVDVFAYNSKAYYVIADGGGYGQQVFKFPSTGNETVLDAINNIGGLPPVSSRRRIWVARPAPANHECLQILPVDWLAIVQGGATRTNYQLFPGDRVYIKADPFIALDNWLAKVFAPVERLLGISLLGATTFQTFRNNGLHGNRNGTGFIVTGF